MCSDNASFPFDGARAYLRDAAYSVPFAPGCRDEKGFKMMLLCQAEVGRAVVGEPHMKHMPEMHPDDSYNYHSFVTLRRTPRCTSSRRVAASPAYIVHFS